MAQARNYLLEHLLLASVGILAVTGFWNLYFGGHGAPGLRQHLHLAVNFLWLSLLFWQLRLVAGGNFAGHRTVGALVLFLAPLLVASTAMLSVHSAQKGLLSGQGDPMLIQNVMGTIELGLLVALAFHFRTRRRLHGAFMLATAVIFLGIALFFTFLGVVPFFRIEGPETFHRFAIAAMTGQAICLAVGLVFVLRDYRNGWPLLLAAAFFPLNDLFRMGLERQDLISPLTAFVASMSEAAVFVSSFVAMCALLLALGVRPARPKSPPVPADGAHTDV